MPEKNPGKFHLANQIMFEIYAKIQNLDCFLRGKNDLIVLILRENLKESD